MTKGFPDYHGEVLKYNLETQFIYFQEIIKGFNRLFNKRVKSHLLSNTEYFLIQLFLFGKIY